MQKTFMRGEKKLLKALKKEYFRQNLMIKSKKQQTSKKFNEKEFPKKPTKVDVKEFSELIIKKEKDIDKNIFKIILAFKRRLH